MPNDLLQLLDREPFSSFLRAWRMSIFDGKLPARRDIKLAEFASFADNIVIITRLSPTDFRYRLQGSSVASRLGEVGADTNLLTLFEPKIREPLLKWYNDVFDQSLGGLMDYSVIYPTGAKKSVLQLILPIVRRNGERLSMALHGVQDAYGYGPERTMACAGSEWMICQSLEVTKRDVTAGELRAIMAKPDAPAGSAAFEPAAKPLPG